MVTGPNCHQVVNLDSDLTVLMQRVFKISLYEHVILYLLYEHEPTQSMCEIQCIIWVTVHDQLLQNKTKIKSQERGEEN